MWFSTSNPPSPEPPPVAPPAKQTRLWLRWAIPAFAFLLGVGIGGAGTDDVTAAPQYVQLEERLESTEDEADQLSDQVEDARAQIAQAGADAEAKIQQQAAVLEQRSAELDQRETALTTRESALRSIEQAPAPAAAPVVVPEPAPAPAASAYYENCDAARAAGAAPVRTGDPGYGGHLDRDGDGVACE